MIKLNLKQLHATNEVFKRLNILRRWTSFVTEDRYNELSKQALNCIVAFMIASHCEEEGMEIHWERFPKIALYRAFQKVYVYFDTPEHIIDEICDIADIKKPIFNDVTKNIIEDLTDKEFTEFICEGIGTQEMQIYKAATKIATYIELVENQANMKDNDEYFDKTREVLKSLSEFSTIPGVEKIYINTNGNLFKLLMKVSKLRNQNRWSVMAYTTECSVLGHLFDTAVFSYFIGLEKNPKDEKLAAKMFFMGIFHDVAEAWTTDIPSPIKDKIPGFRDATEVYELKVLEEKLYKFVPNFLAEKLRSVMFEDKANEKYKKLLKGADYLSADSECWRQYKAGSRDDYFLGAIQRYHKKLENGIVELTPVCNELHVYFMNYAEALDL